MKKRPLIFMFFIVLFSLSFVDMVIQDRDFSSLENRILSKKPKATLQSLISGTYLEKYEKYINDQFLLRDNFISLKSRFEYIQGKSENNNILYGKNNRLFEKIVGIDEDRLNKNMEAIGIFSKSTETRVSFLLAPNSSEIYNEDMPYGSYTINQEENIGNIYSALSNTNNINVVDILRESRDEYIYYNTDHHWTSYGAYLAYKKLCIDLGVESLNIENLNKKTVENFFGTYFSKAKNFNAKADTLTYYELNSNIEMTVDNTVYSSLYDYEKALEVDKYGLFLRGNSSLTIIKNNDLNNNKKLLVIKDSYANSLVPFLTENFQEIHVVDLRSFSTKISDYIKGYDFNEILVLYNYNTFIRDTSLVKIKY